MYLALEKKRLSSTMLELDHIKSGGLEYLAGTSHVRISRARI